MDNVNERFPEERGTARDLGQDRPHSARMYDYYLGGKINYAVDREAARAVIQQFPAIRVGARINRAFMHRATRYLAGHAVRQFLDIGTGIPTTPNLHQVAQEAAPDTRVVYVDNDPIVLTYVDGLMVGTPEGETAYVEADITDPSDLITAVEEEGCIDFEQPVALALHALLHFVPGEDAYRIVTRLLHRLAPGSYVSLTHVTGDFAPESWNRIVELYTRSGTPAQVRSRAEVLRFFDGLELVEPGLVVAHRWRPAPASGPSLVSDSDASLYAGVGMKR